MYARFYARLLKGMDRNILNTRVQCTRVRTRVRDFVGAFILFMHGGAYYDTGNVLQACLGLKKKL